MQAREMRKVNVRAMEIQRRFFMALETAIELGAMTGLQEFCSRHGLNRTKYSILRNSVEDGHGGTPYKCIDIDALAAICEDSGVSPEWLLMGKGKMLRKEVL